MGSQLACKQAIADVSGPVVYQSHGLCVLINLLGRIIEAPASSKRQRDPVTATVMPLQQQQNHELSKEQSVDPVRNNPAAVNQTHPDHKNGKQKNGKQVAGSRGPRWTPTREETEAVLAFNKASSRPVMEYIQAQLNEQ